MTAELKFDRARWEAGEMPRLRDGSEVVFLHLDEVRGKLIGIHRTPIGSLASLTWRMDGHHAAGLGNLDGDLVHDPLPTPATPEPPGVYMVSVDGRDAPQCEHPSLESAMREAERLSKCGARNKIRVLRVERVYVPTHRTDWDWREPAPVDDVPF